MAVNQTHTLAFLILLTNVSFSKKQDSLYGIPLLWHECSIIVNVQGK